MFEFISKVFSDNRTIDKVAADELYFAERELLLSLSNQEHAAALVEYNSKRVQRLNKLVNNCKLNQSTKVHNNQNVAVMNQNS